MGKIKPPKSICFPNGEVDDYRVCGMLVSLGFSVGLEQEFSEEQKQFLAWYEQENGKTDIPERSR